MSRSQDPQKPLFPFGNPFKRMLPKGSSPPPKLTTLLTKYEDSLAQRMRKLTPTHPHDVCSLQWMASAMSILSDTHRDIKTLIAELELPVNEWDEKWIDTYLDNSVKFLDICIALSSEISQITQGNLLLQCVLLHVRKNTPTELLKAKSSLDSWRQHIAKKNPRTENCSPLLETLKESLGSPRVKNSAKGKVLMQALYGVRVETLYICSVFLSAFTGSDKLVDLQVPSTHLWAEAFNDLQRVVSGEIRRLISTTPPVIVLKELEGVDSSLKSLYPVLQAGAAEPKNTLQKSETELGNSVEKLSSGLDVLAKEVDGFFQVLMNGRDALLSNLRVSAGSKLDSPKNKKMEVQVNRYGNGKFKCTYKGV